MQIESDIFIQQNTCICTTLPCYNNNTQIHDYFSQGHFQYRNQITAFVARYYNNISLKIDMVINGVEINYTSTTCHYFFNFKYNYMTCALYKSKSRLFEEVADYRVW